ncbi:hypothetical protein Glove_256g171 [Diversispora epigaea]|uniref:Uncharacterized protein n=1 Tax=Diversispora epigaea TaxID=1348612 RepID=A0A397ICW6_9GLOM|nr:hypothetical protein Glove_256g171 [Diversispora epigaea]
MNRINNCSLLEREQEKIEYENENKKAKVEKTQGISVILLVVIKKLDVPTVSTTEVITTVQKYTTNEKLKKPESSTWYQQPRLFLIAI